MTEEKFKAEYAKLNPQQKDAVDTIEGPVMVIAGPGTGKTTILTLRIANILRLTDTPASGILALTFTEAGVKAMKMKLREIIGSRADEIKVHTFHGFASSVIREFEDHFPHIYRSKQMTAIEEESMMRQILTNKKYSKLRPLGEPDFYVAKILTAIRDAKKEAWTPEMIKSFATEEIERVKNDENSISTRGRSIGNLKANALKRIQKCERTILFGEVYEEYEKTKHNEKKIDFNDLIFELLTALREDELLLQSLQEKYLYIHLDEHQDTNDSQNLIVKMIADFFENPNLFVVGDEKQAIYRFQGASVENFLTFQNKWKTMKVISLVENYRSHQSILDASYNMIEQNYEEGEYKELRSKLKSYAKHPQSPLHLSIAQNQTAEEINLVQKLKDLEQDESSVAIIVRKNKDVVRILSILDQNNIKAKAEKGANIFEHPVGKLFFCLIEFFSDPSKTECLAETFAGGLWGLDFKTQTTFIKKIKEDDLDFIEKELPVLKKLREGKSTSGTLEYLSSLADHSGLTEIAKHDTLSAEVWHSIFDLSRELAESNQIEDAQTLLHTLLDYKQGAEGKYVKISAGYNSSKITIMTSHGSKGLEFDYVFLPYTTEESWISKNFGSFFVMPREKEEGDIIKDERRLFYVAITRARKNVVLSYSEEDYLGKPLTPLRFIAELDQAHIARSVLPKVQKQPEVKTITNKEEKLNQEKIEYAKSVLLEKGLSVTALNHFIKCPITFFYKSILKLPEPPSATSEKGNAMHEALSNVWKNLTPAPSVNFITNIIKSSVTEYFKHSLLPKYEKETILEELLANAPIVAEALLPHFNLLGKVLTESWAESFFDHKYNNEQIELKLHGKLDTVIEQDNKVLVFDYKTTTAKSINEIKGETKNSTGDYFRQLIYYKMLLKNNPSYIGKQIEPSLVFVKPRPTESSGRANEKDRCPTISIPIEQSDVDMVKTHIAALIDSVWSGNFLSNECKDPECMFCSIQN